MVKGVTFMKEEIKKGLGFGVGFGVGFVLAKGLVNGIAGVLVKKLKESETNRSKENTTETEES